MHRPDQDPVLIVGGGIAGLALGRALQTEMLPFDIVERRRTPVDAGLAIILPGNAIRALSTLGLKDQIEAAGHALRRRQYRTANDRLLFEVDEDAFWGMASRPRSVRRSDLLAMLGEGLPDRAIRFDTEVVSMSQHPSHAAVDLRDGSRVRTRLVVGADGVGSTIRGRAFSDGAQPRRALLAETSWRFMAPNPGVDCWTLWTGADGMVLLAPVDRDEVYGWAAVLRPHPKLPPLEALDRMAERMPERARLAVAAARSKPDGLHHSPLQEVRLATEHVGRVVLIGDAGHAAAPVWAQGAALALEDAIVLAQSLSGGPTVAAALEAFANRRRPRVTHVQTMTDVMSKAAALPAFLRTLLMPTLGPKRYRQTYEPLKADI